VLFQGDAVKNGERLFTCGGVFLVSLAALSLQVTLSRVFSVALSYHFAFMVVSLALLGYGASGTFLALFPSILRKKPLLFFSCSAIIFSVTSVGAYMVTNSIPFDPVRISWDRLQLAYLFADYLLLSVPFFFSGLCISGALTYLASEAGRVYFSDLAGAGLGSLLVLILFVPLGGKGMVVFPALVAALGALVFGLGRPGNRWILLLSSVLIGFLVLLLWIRPPILEVRISPYKSLNAALRYPESRLLDTRWNAYSRVDVVDSPLVRFAPGLSLSFMKPIPPQLGITIDGDNMTAMTRYEEGQPSLDFIPHMPDALAYLISERDRALVIEPGGGLGVLIARLLGARKIEVVFDNPLVRELVSERHGEFSGEIFRDPRVVTVIKNGRSFLRQSKASYDVIQFSPLSALGASSTGIRGLQENYMFTVEAIIDLFTHLSPEGVLSVTQYLLPPPRQEIRLVHLVLGALARMEVPRPENHLAMIRTWGTFTLLLKRGPFSEEEIEKINDFCDKERFDTVYFPGMTPSQANRYNRFPRPLYFEIVRDLLSETERNHLVNEYLFDLSPVTDDNPFFFNFFRFKKIVPLYRAMHRKWQPFMEGGYLVPVVLIQSVFASAFLILFPIVFMRRKSISRRRGFRPWVLAYFALLGSGYMFVEIVSIQKLILFLDRPVYAMATVLFGLLISSGFGSFFSQKVTERKLKATLVVVLFVIGLSVWGYLRIIPLVVNHFLGFPFEYRGLLTLALLFPLGFLMGMPLPLYVRFLGRVDPDVIPWAWGTNGCFSVIGSVLSAVLALGIGFSGVLVVAGAVYVGAGSVILISFLNLADHGNKTDVPQMLNI
jgi:spermidine synthase